MEDLPVALQLAAGAATIVLIILNPIFADGNVNVNDIDINANAILIATKSHAHM